MDYIEKQKQRLKRHWQQRQWRAFVIELPTYLLMKAFALGRAFYKEINKSRWEL